MKDKEPMTIGEELSQTLHAPDTSDESSLSGMPCSACQGTGLTEEEVGCDGMTAEVYCECEIGIRRMKSEEHLI